MVFFRTPLGIRRAMRPLRRPARRVGKYVYKNRRAIAKEAVIGAALAASGLSASKYLGQGFVRYGPRAAYQWGRVARVARTPAGRALIYRNARRMIRGSVYGYANRYVPYAQGRWMRALALTPRSVRPGTRRGIAGAYKYVNRQRYLRRLAYIKKR